MAILFNDPRAIPMVYDGKSVGTEICRQCGKTFPLTCDRKEWAFKEIREDRKRFDMFCTWGCLCAWRREHPGPDGEAAIRMDGRLVRNFDGNRMREVREKKKISTFELCQRAGIKLGNVYKYEYGFYNPQRETVIRIADALGVEVEELLIRG